MQRLCMHVVMLIYVRILEHNPCRRTASFTLKVRDHPKFGLEKDYERYIGSECRELSWPLELERRTL